MSNRLISASMLAIMAASIVPAIAGNKLLPGNNSPLKATKVQMGIISPITNTCPAKATMKIWIFTNKPGPINYMIAKKGGNVSGPFTLQSKKRSNGFSMAMLSRIYDIHQALDAEYRVLIPGASGNLMSNWVRMKASCKIMLGG